MGFVVARRVALAVTVIVGLCVAGWVWGLPRYRPEISDTQLFGVDVSNHQGEIDWQLVPSANVGFAYIKATEGSDFTDATFAGNWAQAQAAGLEVGAYHFFSYCTSGEAQAAHFLAVAPPDPTSLPPAVDIEQSGACLDTSSPDRVLQEVQSFLAVVEQAHAREAVVYVLDGFDYLAPVTETRRLWRRSLFRGPVETEWSIWQFHNRSTISGIEGPVDLNIANIEQLRG